MNFQKMELQGFKSFADKTEITFQDGITVIVGPNGCGKTTLLRNLNKNLSPKGGCILLNDMDMKEKMLLMNINVRMV